MRSNTPIANFVRNYAQTQTSRLHMPGHKGVPRLGCEPWDITEITGADVLSDAQGIILQSEGNTTDLYGTAHSFYSTGGSSQCVGAMLYLAGLVSKNPRILAARNAHRSFFHACALLDLQVDWLYPQAPSPYCACPLTPRALQQALSQGQSYGAVYVTSPDYLGGMQDIAGLAAVCKAQGVLLLVDNAHGAYLKFMCPSLHPMDLGADICCDSAHKTLPVLTGGAYLHIAKGSNQGLLAQARQGLALFGSTSPSYLILQSLDLCVPYLAGGFSVKLRACTKRITNLKAILQKKGYSFGQTAEPLKLCIAGNGIALAAHFRKHKVECEFADRDFLVLLFSAQTTEQDFLQVEKAMVALPPFVHGQAPLVFPYGQQQCSIRKALLGQKITLPLANAIGRVCGQAGFSCPPAVPIVAPGESITPQVAALLGAYGVTAITVVE